FPTATEIKMRTFPAAMIPVAMTDALSSDLHDLPQRARPMPQANEPEDPLIAAISAGLPSPANRPDFVSNVMARSIEDYEQQLAETNLNPAIRETYEYLLTNRRRQLADHQTNFLLWSNVEQAKLSKDKKQLAEARQQLADYLSATLGRIQGKSYPTGMDLD